MRLLPTLLRRAGSLVRSHPDYTAPSDIESGIAKWTKQYANLPERYLLRKTRKLDWKSPPGEPSIATHIKTSKAPEPTMDRPWTSTYWTKHRPKFKSYHGTFAEPIKEEDWMWFRGDRVEVTVGADKGKQGYINYIVQERNWVCVEGLNCKYEVQGKTADFPGLVIPQEEPLTVTTDLKLVDPTDEKATEVEWRFNELGERVRVSVRTGAILPMPSEAFQTQDYKTPGGYAESKEKDTLAKDVEEITFEPKLCTFEMDIMERQGIVEDRVPQKTFWY